MCDYMSRLFGCGYSEIQGPDWDTHSLHRRGRARGDEADHGMFRPDWNQISDPASAGISEGRQILEVYFKRTCLCEGLQSLGSILFSR